MKTLDLIEVDIQDGENNVTYEFLVKACLNNPPEGGFTRNDFKERERIENSIKDNKMELEDSDCENFKKIVNAMRWAIRDKIIHEFIKAVEAL